jgi:diketogulonate reductase-like aldo/keto reductase
MEFVTVDGDDVPALGLGTWQITGPACERAVRDALELGYRHIDTAQAYDNEQQVGAALNGADVDRNEIFLTTKVWHENVAHEDVLRTTEESLRKLETDYLDLLLIHWPVDDVPFEETLDAMMELQSDDKVRHIGVSNFTPSQLERAADHAPVVCNQVEYHPYLGQQDLLEAARELGVALTAYSPLARGRVVDDPTLRQIGDAHGKSPAQITLRWFVQQDDVITIPKASSHNHRAANFEIFDFELTDDEMHQIFELDEGDRIIDPSFAPTWEN